MNKTFAFSSIENDTFETLLQKYPEILPAKLIGLDAERYERIPNVVRERNDAGGSYLSKDEAFTLVTWKVSHGKFRPTLKSLFQQNTDDSVRDTTRAAFAAYTTPGEAEVKRALDLLTGLRGIGPATASLLLSVYDPETAPFFSVGSFGWAMNKPGHGREWEQGIKYNVKEYLELFNHVQRMRERLGVAAIDIEKAGYVLGHTGEGAANDAKNVAGKKRKAGEQEEDLKPEAVSKPSTRSSARKKAK